jgi:hypothetical protein
LNVLIKRFAFHAVGTAAIAEPEIAKALGFYGCKCNFPPIIMLTVSYTGAEGQSRSDVIYECPKRGDTTAGPSAYSRTALPRIVVNPRGI